MRQPYWLFGLFALYGPSLNLVGEMRYVEIVVLGLIFINFKQALRSIGRLERLFVFMFLLAAIVQIVSDLVNDAELSGTLKRAGTYFILAILVIALKWLAHDDPVRIRWMLAGYCVSYVFIMFIGTSTSAHYADIPWRLGLGAAVTIAVCLSIAWRPSLFGLGALVLFALAIVHLLAGGRGLAMMTLITAVLAMFIRLRSNGAPGSFRPYRIASLLVVGIIGIFGLYEGLKQVTEAGLLPVELQTKMEMQLSNPYGLLAAARPDTVAALYAISKRPLIGFGSTNVDPEVYRLYIDVSIAAYVSGGSYDGILTNALAQRMALGTPSHSHIFGAWADAGFLAALGWIGVLLLSIYVLARTALWNEPHAPFFIFVSLLVIWDVLCSPGPHRMDMALKLMVLFYATEVLWTYDRAAAEPRCARLRQLKTIRRPYSSRRLPLGQVEDS